MNTQLEQLNELWELDAGFFGLLRRGIFDEAEYEHALDVLKNWRNDGSDVINKDVVSGLWFIPVFMERQKEITCEKYSPKKYFAAQEEVIDALAGILGYP